MRMAVGILKPRTYSTRSATRFPPPHNTSFETVDIYLILGVNSTRLVASRAGTEK